MDCPKCGAYDLAPGREQCIRCNYVANFCDRCKNLIKHNDLTTLTEYGSLLCEGCDCDHKDFEPTEKPKTANDTQHGDALSKADYCRGCGRKLSQYGPLELCDACYRDTKAYGDDMEDAEVEILNFDNNGAKSEQLSPGVEQIPFEALEACGEIFAEGEIKYGRDNWKKGVGDKIYQTERCRHAIRHLMKWANGDHSEPHLAKVMWFCVTQIWTEKRIESNTTD